MSGNQEAQAAEEALEKFRLAPLRKRIAELEAALEPFVGMSAWLEALVEVGEIDPMEDHAAVFQISGGGGSNAITVGDLRRAARALAGKDSS